MVKRSRVLPVLLLVATIAVQTRRAARRLGHRPLRAGVCDRRGRGSGGGADIWGASDAFHFAYTTLSGDGRVVARVNTIENLAPWAKAGVMIRESLDPGSPHAFMLLSAGRGLAFQRRHTAGGLSTSTGGGPFAAPRWLRIDRSGSRFTAYQSADGAAWTLVGSDTIPTGSPLLVGLAVSSHPSTAAAAATFDNVTVTPAAPALCHGSRGGERQRSGAVRLPAGGLCDLDGRLHVLRGCRHDRRGGDVVHRRHHRRRMPLDDLVGRRLARCQRPRDRRLPAWAAGRVQR